MTRYLCISAASILTVYGLVCTPSAVYAQGATGSGLEVAVGTTTGVVEATPTPAAEAPAATDSASTSTNAAADAIADHADATAAKLVPVTGETIKSTDDAELNPGSVVAAPPSIILEQNQLILREGETTEARAIDTGAALLRAIGLSRRPPVAPELLESSDPSSGSLEFNKNAVRDLIGADPTVVYRVIINETPLPDPMVVPWIRNLKLLQERFDKALEMLANNQVDEGRAELLFILSEYPTTEHAQQAKSILERLKEIAPTGPSVKTPKPTAAAAQLDIQINPNVKVGTVIAEPASPQDNRVMIGGRTYKVGDSVRSFPNHKILSISEEVVTIEVEVQGQKKSFDVPVRPPGAT